MHFQTNGPKFDRNKRKISSKYFPNLILTFHFFAFVAITMLATDHQKIQFTGTDLPGGTIIFPFGTMDVCL